MSEYLAISLVSVYRTNEIDGKRPSKYRESFTQYLVLELKLEGFTFGFDDYKLNDFWLFAHTDDNYFDYEATGHSLDNLSGHLEVYYNESARESMAFQIVPISQNFMLCY